MPKSSEYGTPDEENPEWMPGTMAKAMRLHDLPPEMQAILAPKQGRGPQKSPTKQPVNIRLSRDVLSALRAKGRGWQAIVDDTLREKFIKRV